MFIYQIINKITNDFYIGKTQKTISNRFNRHKYNANNKKIQTHLYRAIRKYGINNFIIIKLDEAETTNDLNQKEILWIQKLKPKYNMTNGGDGGDTSLSPNFIESMKKYHNNKDLKSYATYGMLGKNLSDEHLKAIKKSNSCPVMCDGVEFASIGEAQLSYPSISIRKRIDNEKYPNFYRLKSKIKRK